MLFLISSSDKSIKAGLAILNCRAHLFRKVDWSSLREMAKGMGAVDSIEPYEMKLAVPAINNINDK